MTALARFHALVARLEYKDWRIHVRTDAGADGTPPSRAYLQVRFMAACHRTGAREIRHGRKWMLSPHMTDSEVVQTAFKACLAAEEHECREAFKYRGQPVFGPHLDVDWLADTMRERDVTSERAPRAQEDRNATR